MAIFQQGETYQHIRMFREGSSPTNVTSASMEITFPCDSGTTDVAMTNTAVGTYQAMWDIPADAVYGEYEVEVTALTGTTVSKFVSAFYILPWDITQQIRSVSGIGERKSIDDDDLAVIAWDAYQEVLAEIYEFHTREKVRMDPDVNLSFDGTNKTFRINVCNYDELADRYGDGTITGWGETSCGTDVDGYWIDLNFARHQLKITVEDVITGRVTLSQTDDTAIPANHQGVRVWYWTQSETWNERLMRKAVVYFASHEVLQRFNQLDRVTLADVESNRAVFLANPNRLEKIYKKTRDKIRHVMFGGTK